MESSRSIDAKEEEVASIKEIVSSLPQENGCKIAFCLYQGHWNSAALTEGTILVQKNFKPQSDDDIFLCSAPKTGTTWLKALAFAVLTRTRFDICQSTLLTKVPHDCVPIMELHLKKHDPNLPLWSTHIPYSLLPQSITDSSCKLVYIWRDPKDVFVSMWHFLNRINSNSCREIVSLEEAFELFCKGISSSGPYWDHVLEFWKASLERPDKILFLKYEEMMEDTEFHLKRLAKFIGHPFSPEEEIEGVVQNIVNLCSFDNLSKVNKTEKYRVHFGKLINSHVINNADFFRKGEVGDWENYLSFEMGQKLDKIMAEKFGGFGFNK